MGFWAEGVAGKVHLEIKSVPNRKWATGPRATAAGKRHRKDMAERNIIQCRVQVMLNIFVVLLILHIIYIYISCVTHHLSPYIHLLLTLFVYIWENVGGRSHMHT